MNTGNDATTRIWRLAILLSESEAAARSVITEAVRRRSDLAHLPAERQERLVLLCAREMSKAPARAKRPPPRSLRAILKERHRQTRGRQATEKATREGDVDQAHLGDPLARAQATLRTRGMQSLEAWILAVVQQRDIIEVARVMDCSKTAAGRHLEAARETLNRTATAPDHHELQALRDVLEELKAPFDIRKRTMAPRPLSRRPWFIAVLAVAMVAIAIVVARFL